MSELVLTTYDWVPEPPRGLVRDLRVRWALEEAGLAYRVESTPFRERPPAHYAHQPFGQVPWLRDGELTIFETGAILLHLGERSAALMPPARESRARSEVLNWVFAALNSIEMVSQPWALYAFYGAKDDRWGPTFFGDWLNTRLKQLEALLAEREWLAAGAFSIADILMADVLRLVDRFEALAPYPAVRAYVQRATARPAFQKAHADQLAHFAAADRAAN